MKNLFLFLLFVNIVLALWIYSKQEAPQEMVAQRPLDAQPLVLLHEAPKVNFPITQEPLAEVVVNEVVVADHDADIAAQDADELTREDVVFEGREDVIQAVEVSTTAVHEEMPKLERYCFVITPIKDKDRVSEIGEALTDRMISYRLEEAVAEEQAGFWVLVPSSGDRNEALEVVKELKRQGLPDVRRFTAGKLKNSVSLGLFKKRGYAERQSNIAREKGFKAIIQARNRQIDTSVFHIETGDSRFSERDEWLQISANHPDLELQTSMCDSE